MILGYRKVVAKYPRSGYSDNALLACGNLYREMAVRFRSPRYREDALSAYRTLVAEYPSSSLGDDALWAAVEMARDAKDHRQAGGRLAGLPRHVPGGPAGLPGQEAHAGARAGRPLPSPPPPGLARVYDLRSWSGDSSTRVVIDVERIVRLQSDRAANPDRLWIDLLGTRLHPNLARRVFPVGDGLLEQVRIAKNRDDVVRVVLDFKDVGEHQVFYLENPTRLVIDVQGGTRARSSVAEGPAPALPTRSVNGMLARRTIPPASPSVPASGPIAIVGVDRVPGAVPAPARGAPPPPAARRRPGPAHAAPGAPGHEPRRLVQPRPPARPRRPPHRHRRRPRRPRPRARSAAGACRRRTSSSTSPCASSASSGRSSGPRSSSPVQPTSSCRSRSGPPSPTRGGPTSSCLDPRELEPQPARPRHRDLLPQLRPQPHAEAVAARENAISPATLKDLQNLVKAITLNSKIDESRDFAAAVQEHMVAGVRREHVVPDRGVHTAPFYVLIGANMPAVLAEIAFVSNPDDEKRLKTAEYREILARSLLARRQRLPRGAQPHPDAPIDRRRAALYSQRGAGKPLRIGPSSRP